MPAPRPGPVVYLPVSLDADGQVADVSMLKLADGRVAMLAYTALDRLVDCCGEHQPWTIFDVGQLDALHEVKPFDVKYLDVELPAEFRVPAPGGAPDRAAPARPAGPSGPVRGVMSASTQVTR